VEGLLIILALLLVLGSLLGLIAFLSLSSIRRDTDELRAVVQRQALTIERLQKALASGLAPPQPEPAAPAKAPEPREARPAQVTVPASAARVAPPSPPPAKPQQPLRPSFEEQLTSRWLVWLGAATIALGGVFLVKFSIDYGLITPEMRVIFGFLFGVALVAGGEWLRRRGDKMKIEALRGSYVPPALTSAGLFIAFASTYAAFALYQMLSPLASFIALAVLAAAAIILSIWHGRGVALLGILGGFVTPLLIPSEQPSAWTLFLYLGALVIALVTLIRFMDWFALLWPVLLGIVFWIVVWLDAQWTVGDIAAIGLFLFVTAAAFCAAFWDMPAKHAVAGATPPWPPLDLPPTLLVSLGVVCFGALYAFDKDHYSSGTLGLLAALTALQLGVATYAKRLASLAVTAVLLVLATYAGWPSITVTPDLNPPVVPGAPAAAIVYLWSIGAFGSAFAGIGFALIWRSERALLWAWVSAAAPLALFALAYSRVLNFANDASWAAAAVALAFIALMAAERCLRHRTRPGLIEAAGAYSTAVIAALGLALVMLLEEAWLTVALSLLLPALAWTDRKLDIPAHRTIALAVASVVIVRLILNPDVLSYEAHAFGRASWVLYGYGIPAFACGLAAWIFAERGRDQTIAILEGAALLFAVLTAFFEIRALAAGGMAAPRVDLFEVSLHTLTWGVAAYGLERADARGATPVIAVAWKVLLALAVLSLAFMHLLVQNPLNTGDFVGDVPIVNLLFPAYAAPAVLAAAFALRFRERTPWVQPFPAAGSAWIVCLVLTFVWITLETKRFFQGATLSWSAGGDAELYAYSVVWLIFAGALLAAAIQLGSQALRWASLVVLFLTVGKVFLSDMSALTGLWRVASFIGLGLTLVGIGFLYQRYVFPLRPAEPDGAAPSP
jgi:uncharacterized membrane protein